MGFRLLTLGWLSGLCAALATHLALDVPAPLALAVWSATGTAAFLFGAWTVCRSEAGRPLLATA